MKDIKDIGLPGSRVLILPNPPEETTEAGLLIPTTYREKQYIGKVIATGKGTEEEPMEIGVGDTVVYSPHSGTSVSLFDIDYLIARQSDLLCYFKNSLAKS